MMLPIIVALLAGATTALAVLANHNDMQGEQVMSIKAKKPSETHEERRARMKRKYGLSLRHKLFMPVDVDHPVINDPGNPYKWEDDPRHPHILTRLMTTDEVLTAQTLGDEDVNFKDCVFEILLGIAIGKGGDWNLVALGNKEGLGDINEIDLEHLLGDLPFLGISVLLQDLLAANAPSDDEKK